MRQRVTKLREAIRGKSGRVAVTNGWPWAQWFPFAQGCSPAYEVERRRQVGCRTIAQRSTAAQARIDDHREAGTTAGDICAKRARGQACHSAGGRGIEGEADGGLTIESGETPEPALLQGRRGIHQCHRGYAAAAEAVIQHADPAIHLELRLRKIVRMGEQNGPSARKPCAQRARITDLTRAGVGPGAARHGLHALRPGIAPLVCSAVGRKSPLLAPRVPANACQKGLIERASPDGSAWHDGCIAASAVTPR